MKLVPSLGSVCAQGLPGAPALPPVALDAGAWEQLLRDAVDERAIPLLARAVSLGRLVVSPVQRQAAVAAHEESMRACLFLERAALDVAECLQTARIEFRLLKGAAVAHLDYPDPAWRAFGDVDLLVRSSAYEQAVRVLEGLGARRRFAEVRRGFDERFGKGVCMVMPDAVQIDLHRTFVSGPFGLTIRLDDLFSGREQVSIGGASVPVLDREQRFLHACYHAALGDVTPRLVALRDVAQLLLCDELDFELAREIAHDWRAEIVMARAITLAWRTLELEAVPHVSWAERYDPDRFESRSLATYVGPDRSYARQMAAGVYAVRGLAAKAAYVRSLLAVDATYARRHDGGYRRRLHRAWRSRSGRRLVG